MLNVTLYHDVEFVAKFREILAISELSYGDTVSRVDKIREKLPVWNHWIPASAGMVYIIKVKNMIILSGLTVEWREASFLPEGRTLIRLIEGTTRSFAALRMTGEWKR